MSRGQENQTFDTASGQNQGYFNNAQNSYSNAQADIGDYQKQLSDYAGQVAKFNSSNPYVQGGEFQTAQNQQLANTADASARAAGEALQGQALRTGQNTAGAIAATENMQQTNERNLAGQEAAATQQRIGSEAGYNEQGVGNEENLTKATAVPAQMETTLAGQQGELGNAALSEEEKAAQTPSWMEEFGNALAENVGKGGLHVDV